MSGALMVASLLLIGAGGAKVVRPHDTVRAMRGAGLPVGVRLVRSGALLEVGIGCAALTIGGPLPAGAVGVSYLGFAAFLAVAIGRGWSLSSCGCFGQPDTPPTPMHIVVDVVLAAGAGLAASGRGAPALAVVAARPFPGVVTIAMATVTAGLVYLVLSRLPELELVTR